MLLSMNDFLTGCFLLLLFLFLKFAVVVINCFMIGVTV